MSVHISIISFIFLSTTFNINNAYYLSLHALEWLNASTYCQSHCNSHLASVHSTQQHTETLHLIDENPHTYTRVWLGLNDIKQSDTWEWSDGSNFNFASNLENGKVIKGQYPWRSDEPDYDNDDQAVALEVGSNYAVTNTRRWIDRNIAANYHFFCNDCSGKINKYAILNDFSNFTHAGTMCEDTFGTSLASIHSADDMAEAVEACKAITNSNGCWIGLNDQKTRRKYEWTDGTEWDYGRDFFLHPWYKSEPGSTTNQNCIFMDPSNGDDPGEYLWDDYWCHRTSPRPLCNAPSEICNKNQWVVIRGDENNWIWNSKPCHVIKQSLEIESVAVLSNKQYVNTNGLLKIDMMYSVTYVSPHTRSNAGIVLYLDEYSARTNCNNYYYIGIDGEAPYIFFGKYVNNVFHLLSSKALPTYHLGTQGLLSIELHNGIHWNILLNKESMITRTDNSFNNHNNIKSGYIGIRNINSELNIKYLYISGTTSYENNNIWFNTCANPPTFAPTEITINPSTSPTKNPTISPSNNPSKYPTLYPSNNPSETPTKIPTTAPTKNPTKFPTTNPSKSPTLLTLNPSNIPTSKPTKFPTISPTKFPTISPTNNPSKVPTFFPSISPTKFPTISPTNNPTISPTNNPTISPTNFPSISPTKYPTFFPSISPTKYPTVSPTKFPTSDPTNNPTKVPTLFPSLTPTKNPSKTPTNNPSNVPTNFPSVSPSKKPTYNPSNNPTSKPTYNPSNNPTKYPSNNPTTNYPTQNPTTAIPTENPTKRPTDVPSESPSKNPTKKPTMKPSGVTYPPTDSPSEVPSESPSLRPTFVIEREFPIIEKAEKDMERNTYVVAVVSSITGVGICLAIIFCYKKVKVIKFKRKSTTGMDTLPDVEAYID